MLLLALQLGGTSDKFAWNSANIIGMFVGAGVTLPVVIAWQLYLQDAALIPPRLFSSSRNIALVCTAAFFSNGAFQCIIYWLPIWFQAVLGASPTSSGVRYLPTVIADVLTSIIAAALVTKLGYWNPFLIFGAAMVSLGGGLLSTLHPAISEGHWIGFQILGGIGYSLIVTFVSTLADSLPGAKKLTIDTGPLGRTSLAAPGVSSIRSNDLPLHHLRKLRHFPRNRRGDLPRPPDQKPDSRRPLSTSRADRLGRSDEHPLRRAHQ